MAESSERISYAYTRHNIELFEGSRTTGGGSATFTPPAPHMRLFYVEHHTSGQFYVYWVDAQLLKSEESRSLGQVAVFSAAPQAQHSLHPKTSSFPRDAQ